MVTLPTDDEFWSSEVFEEFLDCDLVKMDLLRDRVIAFASSRKRSIFGECGGRAPVDRWVETTDELAGPNWNYLIFIMKQIMCNCGNLLYLSSEDS